MAAPPLDSPCDRPVTYPQNTKILVKSSKGRSGSTLNNTIITCDAPDLTNCMKFLVCSLVRCSNRVGQVSPVRAVAFRRFHLSFSSCVHFKIIFLIVSSSFSPKWQVELGIIFNLLSYDLVKT